MKIDTGTYPILTLDLFSIGTSEPLVLSLFESDIPAGYPAQADTRIALKLDLNRHLIKHPAATFYARVKGGNMEELDLEDGDILVVDRAVELRENDLVVCKVDENFTVKRAYLNDLRHNLKTESLSSYLIRTFEQQNFHVCGVVTFIIHKP
ncbi:S24 family peptidase [Catalinimonas sp. 4WD22]|uniref:LexA family protein n=1 Tax=Catalinimonas locisalis TaxID=3133978 RepID=UPI0031011980